TSACAEKRHYMPASQKSRWKYLRVCGEEALHASFPEIPVEIPPRVRRRAGAGPCLMTANGNTSACAEKSSLRSLWVELRGKYLRVCGEELVRFHLDVCSKEIPPRVRRRARLPLFTVGYVGNTSACAEKRYGMDSSASTRWKYLRVCGEEFHMSSSTRADSEIPPRVRRRARSMAHDVRGRGNTSACAEKSSASTRNGEPARKYLRVCGEEIGLANVVSLC